MSITIGDFSESSGKYSEITPCRLCMKKNDYFYNIFTSIVASQITVEDALYDLVHLKVAVGDGLPATLCALCLEKLIEFNDFRNICHKSDAELRNVSCINYSRGIGGEGAVHDNLRSSTETKSWVRDVIVSTSEKACSVQPNEIFIPVPDIQLPTANMLDENMSYPGWLHLWIFVVFLIVLILVWWYFCLIELITVKLDLQISRTRRHGVIYTPVV